MKIAVFEDSLDFNRKSAAEIINRIKYKPDSVVCFATGNTTKGVYKEIVNINRTSKVDFSGIAAFNLDEYTGLPLNHPATCYARLQEDLYKHININEDNIHYIHTEPPSLEEESKEFDSRINLCGGIDLQILGIGENGHIGFNDPGTPFESVTRVVNVNPKSIESKIHMFDSLGRIPAQAITMGIKTIMAAKKIMLLAKGKEKAEIVSKALKGPVITDVPASVLQLHPDLTVLLDKEAASCL